MRSVIPISLALLAIIGGVFGYKYFAFGSAQINSIAVMPFRKRRWKCGS
jgi:hypothetical protein